MINRLFLTSRYLESSNSQIAQRKVMRSLAILDNVLRCNFFDQLDDY